MAKRGAHEGSIYKRSSDGRWAGAITLPDGHRKHFLGRTRAEVATKLQRGQHLRSRGLPLPDERTTVADFLHGWLETVRPTIRPRTFEGYADNVENHLLPAFGGVRLARLTAQAIDALLAKKLGAGLSAQTVRNIHATLRGALTHAVRWGLLPQNPASLVTPPRVPRVERKAMSLEEAQRFLDVVAADRLVALYYVSMLGERQGEIRACGGTTSTWRRASCV
jgi:integrase